LLKKELNIFTFNDLLEYYPYRHIDRTKINLISDIKKQQLNSELDNAFVQIAVVLVHVEVIGKMGGRRLVAQVKDKSGSLELTWFQGVAWVQKLLETGQSYLVYGKISFFNGQPQIIHPEFEVLTTDKQVGASFLEPIYYTTEKLKARGLGGRKIGNLTQLLISMLKEKDIPENIPFRFIQQLHLPGRYNAIRQIHFPKNSLEHDDAVKRIKFEEFFIAQLRMQMLLSNRHRFSKGPVFDTVGELFNDFYKNYLPFELTKAQKRVIKEIRVDTANGKQMNRLLQGDVGSGKTIVAILIMLLAIDNKRPSDGNAYQACLMAPTEILAQQHYKTISRLLEKMNISIKLLTGSVKAAQRKKIIQELADGSINILIGTHAVIEDVVQFNNLGIVIIDEQHRFGVAQRAKLWQKAVVPPHVLVMTATPIPRTLAMTAYGDLDYSVIDELPPGRKPISTVHRFESKRSNVMEFIKTEIEKGRQIYIIFPLIEESIKLDYENLMKGYENVKAYFPEPKYWISMVHGRQPQEQKEMNMKRFIEKDTQIMVSTTVIEVGVDVPNASVMVIESAEKFGLSQLHQLRGRVGRGAEKSYCILLTGSKLGNVARERIKTMELTNNGFEIAEKDLELRGPGDIEGTRQSGALNFKLASLVHDRDILDLAKKLAGELLDMDPDLVLEENNQIKNYLKQQTGNITWSKIS
jgi:ATP-dependent DNA helicase RecG